jgi:myosin heavy subunit
MIKKTDPDLHGLEMSKDDRAGMGGLITDISEFMAISAITRAEREHREFVRLDTTGIYLVLLDYQKRAERAEAALQKLEEENREVTIDAKIRQGVDTHYIKLLQKKIDALREQLAARGEGNG